MAAARAFYVSIGGDLGQEVGRVDAVKPLGFSLRDKADVMATDVEGNMIDLPSDLHSTPGPWQAFVRTPDDINAYHITPAMIAVVSPAGVLRLYEFTGTLGSGAPDLRPLN